MDMYAHTHPTNQPPNLPTHHTIRTCAGDEDKDQRLTLPELWAVLKQHFAGKPETGTHSPIRRQAPAGEDGVESPGGAKGGKLTDEDVARLFAAIDVGGEGYVTWPQFRAHLAKQALPGGLII